MKDFKKLVEVYFKLIRLEGEVAEIENRHPGAKKFKEVLNKAIAEMHDAAHLIFKEAHELRNMEKQDEQKGV